MFQEYSVRQTHVLNRCGSKFLFVQDDRKFHVKVVFVTDESVPVSNNLSRAVACKFLRDNTNLNTNEEK